MQGPPTELDARQRRWVERAFPRVRPLALRLVKQLSRVTVEDLEGVGHEALVRAALRYDPETGVPFERYAHYRIRGAMIDHARSQNRAGRQHGRAEKALSASQALLEEASRRGEAEAGALAERVAAAKALVERTAAAAMMVRANDTEVDAIPAGDRPDAESRLMTAQAIARLREQVERLPADQRALIEAVYVEGVTMQEHAHRISKSLSTVSRRHAKILQQLANSLRREGVDR